MDGRTSAPKVVVVHTWEIVVHERVCVDNLDRCRELADVGAPSRRSVRGEKQQTSETFSTAK